MPRDGFWASGIWHLSLAVGIGTAHEHFPKIESSAQFPGSVENKADRHLQYDRINEACSPGN